MQALSAEALLRLCELGQGRAPVHKALLLLQVACPDDARETLAALPIGRRDRHLIELRARTLGPAFESEATCPACRERLEFGFTVDDILVDRDESPTSMLSVQQAAYTVHFRLPASTDVIALTQEPGNPPAAHGLLTQCIEAIESDDPTKGTGVGDLPVEVTDAVIEAIARADPQAEFKLNMQCPVCEHGWQEIFDITTYLWQELASLANNVLGEVHQLARAYGWSEHDILAMSSWRRQQYLERLAS